MRSGKPIEVLLIEDSSSDAALVTDALSEHRIKTIVHHVRDGDEAMRFLLRAGEYSQASAPDLIFLDLNIPRKDGREFLEEVKKSEQLRMIPVVVMTTSAAETDVRTAYQRHASSYIVKPIQIDHFFEVMKTLCDYWFDVVRLPERSMKHTEV